MIQYGRATFSVNSTETDPDLISEVLGLEPTAVVRAGAERRFGKPLTHHHWEIDGPRLGNSEADQTGSAALAELLSLVTAAAGKIEGLPPDCDARIWWSADSDSTQGGFVLPAGLVRAIADLGVHVYATIHLESDDGAD